MTTPTTPTTMPMRPECKAELKQSDRHQETNRVERDRHQTNRVEHTCKQKEVIARASAYTRHATNYLHVKSFQKQAWLPNTPRTRAGITPSINLTLVEEMVGRGGGDSARPIFVQNRGKVFSLIL